MVEYVSIEQAATLLGTDYTTVWRRIRRNKYTVRERPSDKQAGKTVTDIQVATLPADVQAKLLSFDSVQDDSKNQIPPAPFVEGGANNNSGIGPLVSRSEGLVSPTDQSAWYQSLKPEHRTIIEKRLAIIEGIGRVLDASKEKNKTQLIIDLASSFKISRDKFYRWKKAYERDGLYGLRHKSFGTKRTKLNEEQCKYILSLIRFNPDCRDRRIWEYVLDEFPSNPVSGVTVSRFVRKWKVENPDVFEWLRNPDAWKSKYALAFGSQSEKAHHFLHYVELDSTPADVMCNDGKRYTIIGGIDIFSRKVKCYVSPSSSGMGVAGLIRSIITDWGVPENFVRDNGKDYVCNQINLALETLAINAITLPPFSPEKKPHIERFFRTMSMCLFEESSGYIGHSVADRKAIEARRTFAERLMKQGEEPVRLNMNPEDLQALINDWVENIYDHRYHDGIETTPEDRLAQSNVAVKKIDDERALDILLLPCGERTVQADGIHYDKARYRTPLFAGWVGKRVNVRRDMDNAGLLYVFDMEHKFICTALDSRIDGMTGTDYKIARKEQKRILKEKVNAIEVLTESPLKRRLERAKGTKKLVSLTQTKTHSTEAIEQASNAALERNGIKPEKFKTVAEQMVDGETFHPEFDESDDPLAFMEQLQIVNE